jgi:hypothetical protein
MQGPGGHYEDSGQHHGFGKESSFQGRADHGTSGVFLDIVNGPFLSIHQKTRIISREKDSKSVIKITDVQ